MKTSRLMRLLPRQLRHVLGVRMDLRRTKREIASSHLFDGRWYLEVYPDVVDSGLDPLDHFVLHGGTEGRDPNPHFSSSFYLEQNPDVALLGINPLVHYIREGAAWGRDPHPDFDSMWYATTFWRAKVGDTPLEDHLRQGRKLGRPTKPLDPEQQRAFASSRPRGEHVEPAHDGASSSERLRVAWVSGESDESWAYGNNIGRLIAQLDVDEHLLDDGVADADVAVHFNLRRHEKAPDRRARRNVLRIGGLRPMLRVVGTDDSLLAAKLGQFDAVIVLNDDLAQRCRTSGVPTFLIPNGLSLDDWHPRVGAGSRSRTGDRGLVVGFAGNMQSTLQRAIKGYDLVVDAAQQAGVGLHEATKRGRRKARAEIAIPHQHMIERFYSRIDCLVHPVAPDKEGCSNVIMEALALGVPVVTTRAAGYHGDRLTGGHDVLFVERTVESLVDAVQRLSDDSELRSTLSANGRVFAEEHHDIREVARQYRNAYAGAAKVSA